MALPLLSKRLYSTLPTPSPSSIPFASTIASQFLKSHTSSTKIQTQTRLLDANQLHLLNTTLSRSSNSSPNSLPADGTPLPPCYHLVYFTPSQIEEGLGRDGTDRSFNPPHPFTRRMWAGGEVEWLSDGNRRGNILRIGEKVEERTKLVSAVGKKGRNGEEMVLVGVEKRVGNEAGEVLVDRRNWIFRPEITIPQPPAPQPTKVPFPSGKHIRDFTQTPVSLFRFSALTFNGHKIHYNKEWCREVEGHRDIVVHGPLNLINMVDLWRDVRGGDVCPKKVTYRATNPLYAGETYRILLDEEAEKVSEVKIVDGFGKVAMVGRIESF